MSASEGNTETTVLVAHPDPEARGQVVSALQHDDDFVVVAHDGSQTLEQLLELMPDVLVISTGRSDFDATTVIATCHDQAPVITVVALVTGDAIGDDALAAGAWSCVHEESADLAALVRGAWRGESVLTAEQASAMLAAFDRMATDLDEAARSPALTQTEREVLERLAQGESATDIADEYEVTDRLVNLHSGYAVGKLHWAFDAERRLSTLG